MTDALQYQVHIGELRQYVNDLVDYQEQVNRFGELIKDNDVGDESWGIVGLFTKEKYTRLLGELSGYVRDAEKFLHRLDERVDAAADLYDALDAKAKSDLDALNRRVDLITPRATVSDATSRVGSTRDGELKAPGAAGAFVKTGTTALKEMRHGTHGDAVVAIAASGHVAVEAGEFAWEVMHSIEEVAENPLRFLVSMGLDFLLEIVGPLEDLVHYVSGNGEELDYAAERFMEIAQGIDQMGENFDQVTDQRLLGWDGVAANAAKQRLADFADGMDGVAGRAGALSELLAMSAIVMEVIEDLIKSIITEFVTWLISLWLPAIASAPVTFGASTAAAGAATAVQATSVFAKVMAWIKKLIKILAKFKEIFIKLAFSLGKAAFKALGTAQRASHGPDREMSNEELGRKLDFREVPLPEAPRSGPRRGVSAGAPDA